MYCMSIDDGKGNVKKQTNKAVIKLERIHVFSEKKYVNTQTSISFYINYKKRCLLC